ncbi:MAG: serine/threonine-protein kinase [Nannocystaceae bacterium]|nr:serine/threonine-protein kinase [Nannocystaceae bacterium]
MAGDLQLDSTLGPETDPHAHGRERTAGSQPGLREGIDTRRIAAQLRERMFGIDSAPIRIGRLIVLDRLGAGAMGVVYSAFDPELDRKVAIKLVQGDASPDARRRLIREAQSIARISHPNVVVVFDVGEHEQQVYVAMELVPGETLRAWLTRPRSWREVVAKFVLAARGLAAAHDGGVIHRDFKPDNVLLGPRGEVKVVDFGLAISAPVTDPAEASTDPAEAASARIQPTTPSGTPAYMSPEQYAGAVLDARSDQFGFCVALFEALWGERPFQGETLPELRAAIISGRLAQLPYPPDVPRWLDAIVRRGLAVDPEARWPSMHALTEALGRDPARTRRRAAVAATALLVAGGAGAVLRGTAPSVAEPCAEADAHLRALWTGEREAALQQQWRADPRPFGVSVADVAGPQLQRWVDAWSAMARDNCEATSVRHEQSAALLDMRTACLHDRAAQFDALVSLFERDRETLPRVPLAILELPGVAACGDPEAVQQRFGPARDPEAVAALRRDLAALRSRLVARPDDDARAQLPSLVDRAGTLAHPPVLLEALLLQGQYATALDVRAQSYDRAYWIAASLHDDTGELDAALGLAHVEGALREHFDDGRRWLRHARAAAVRSHAPLRRLARIDGTAGTIAMRSGAMAEGIVEHGTALALVEADPQVDPLLVSAALVNLAASYNDASAPAQAEPLLERALAIETAAYGPTHPELAAILIDLGNVAYARGDTAACRARFEQAVAVLQAVQPDAIELGMALANLAVILSEQGDDEDAVVRLREALALFERTVGPDHLYVASTLGNLARHLPPDEALPMLQRAIAIYEGHDADNPRIGYALNQLANLYNEQGRSDLALAPARRALAVREAGLGPQHRDVAWSAHVLGDTLLALGQLDEAIALLERAEGIRAGLEGTETVLARTRFVLATALWQRGDRPRARALLQQAMPGLQDASSRDDRYFVERLQRWLADHPDADVGRREPP